MGDLLDLDLALPSSSGGVSGGSKGGMDDLLGLLDGPAPAASTPTFGGRGATSPAAAASSVPKVPLLTKENGQGLEILTSYARRNGSVYMDLQLKNYTAQPMGDFGVQFNKNSFALSPAVALQLPGPLQPGQSADFSLQLNTSGQRVKTDPINLIQIAFKNNVSVFYTQAQVPLHALFSEDGRLEQQQWLQFWQEHAAMEQKLALNNIKNIGQVQAKLASANVFVIGSRQNNGNVCIVF